MGNKVLLLFLKRDVIMSTIMGLRDKCWWECEIMEPLYVVVGNITQYDVFSTIKNIHRTTTWFSNPPSKERKPVCQRHLHSCVHCSII